MEALAFDTPELILLDIMLPGEDGLDPFKEAEGLCENKGYSSDYGDGERVRSTIR